ncbi:MAG: hypothetical protein OEY29_01990 [Gammaproteobacteria bacterium]|nr:hypothetical protein [Gammaproteobacteria bacterium]
MFNIKNLIVASAATMLLNGCASNSDSISSAISVLSISGAMVSLDGTYDTGCVDRSLEGGSGYYRDTTIISGNILSNSGAEYSDSACTLDEVPGALTGSIAVTGTTAITGWTGAGDMTGAFIPEAADGSGPIGTSESVTTLAVTVSSATGYNAGIPANFAAPIFFVVDDTGAKKVLYEDDDYFSGSTLANNIAKTEI